MRRSVLKNSVLFLSSSFCSICLASNLFAVDITINIGPSDSSSTSIDTKTNIDIPVSSIDEDSFNKEDAGNKDLKKSIDLIGISIDF